MPAIYLELISQLSNPVYFLFPSSFSSVLVWQTLEEKIED